MFKKEELGDNALIIAEVGQNHQGSLELAREYIRIFAAMGADVIKFQTRNNKYLFSEGAYHAPYTSENAFDSVYGLHREKLELKIEWLPELKKDCDKFGVKFMSTPFDEPSLEVICDIGVDLIKIASFDLGNLPFIKRIAQKGLPVVMSIGGGNADQIRSSVSTLLEHTDEVCVMHCVSEYPCEFNRLGLDNIPKLIKAFPECTIGVSDHFNGILSGPVAFMKGARVFEKHITMNRSWKGTDHVFALEPDGFRKFVRDIRRVPQMLPPKPAADLGQESVFKKLGKSVIALHDIEHGAAISIDDLSGRIFQEQYIPVRRSSEIIGKRATRKIFSGEIIEEGMFE